MQFAVLMVITTNVRPFYHNYFDNNDNNSKTSISLGLVFSNNNNNNNNLQSTSYELSWTNFENTFSRRGKPDIDGVQPNHYFCVKYVRVFGELLNSLLLGILGNSFTLISIPYARRNFGSEFSILQLNSVILILHLSLCDLLYSVIGFPHLIHAYLYKTNVYSDSVCYCLGMFRNLIAYTDFNTIAVISCCVARQTLCRYFKYFSNYFFKIIRESFKIEKKNTFYFMLRMALLEWPNSSRNAKKNFYYQKPKVWKISHFFYFFNFDGFP